MSDGIRFLGREPVFDNLTRKIWLTSVFDSRGGDLIPQTAEDHLVMGSVFKQREPTDVGRLIKQGNET